MHFETRIFVMSVSNFFAMSFHPKCNESKQYVVCRNVDINLFAILYIDTYVTEFEICPIAEVFTEILLLLTNNI